MKNLVVCAASALIFLSCNDKKEHQNSPVTDTEVKDLKTNMCYLEVTQSKDYPAVRDTMSLTVNIDGNKVTGVYNWLPYEKDKKTGTYEGSIADSVITAVYSYNAEGQAAKEQLIFKLENNQAMIKSGELEEKDGIWKLKDADKAPYSMQLNKMQCK